MPKPYSDDLRRRLVWLKLFYGMSNVDISSTLFVSPKTVKALSHYCVSYKRMSACEKYHSYAGIR